MQLEEERQMWSLRLESTGNRLRAAARPATPAEDRPQ
jgi:hypothetical protein